ncbi:hypothetical protein BDB00DRAFT_820853 [Zychaea mexicana]|uniref:uncharacterized protein n=1 Tax=Zychaea mexicana TaxID=64656 RepID=UPI0022FEC345|nr:uncharacterized protein BDB00DRAFT_820853 [Zychaea mexicana]KAI9494093.1 hypothetical protein BDB00DRAFT_820853 [Zychaea mexicana]
MGNAVTLCCVGYFLCIIPLAEFYVKWLKRLSSQYLPFYKRIHTLTRKGALYERRRRRYDLECFRPLITLFYQGWIQCGRKLLVLTDSGLL